MSVYLVREYIRKVEQVKRFGGSSNEGSLEMEFRTLLNEYCKQKGFILVPKIAIKTSTGKTIIPDGIIKDALRLEWGYWESKDEKDDLEEEIEVKFRKGYPKDNILFEDKITAVLYQGGSEFGRAAMDDPEALDKLLTKFLSYERPEVRTFRKAIELFKTDLPIVVQTLREMIDAQSATNKTFRTAREKFFELCKQVINPDISLDDIREMIIQHILTEDIFNTIFDETQFHRENNIAKELAKVEETFFTGQTKRDTLSSVKQYYDVINASAARIADHHEKQKFLKVIYETFYKAYNPKAADRLGIVYTPGEIVNFMIESTDYLLHKHFNKSLGDKNVEILDPATGTGTFICDIIDYLPANQLEYKYKNEIHANEVAILPYYIANLNIEYTYKQKTGEYAEFESICFVDTLDNIDHRRNSEKSRTSSGDFFALSHTNLERIKRQNESRISVIIGNPPYNANQANENENNKNRTYSVKDSGGNKVGVDERIKKTYIAESTAQKTKVYDMYARFFRWASDRIEQDGILCLITNRSFIDSRTFDGFRKVMRREFAEGYIIDLGGDVRINPKLSGTKHNVFGIQTGVAISIWVKKTSAIGDIQKTFDEDFARIYYVCRPEFDTADEKLTYLSSTKFKDIQFTEIKPDAKNNWINIAENDFEELLPLVDRKTKTTKNKAQESALFKRYTLGVVSARDEWVTDEDQNDLADKVKFLLLSYTKQLNKKDFVPPSVKDPNYETKWTRRLLKLASRNIKIDFDDSSIVSATYRPFTKLFTYFSKELNEEIYQLNSVFVSNNANLAICFSGVPHSKPFQIFCVDSVFHHDFLEKTQCAAFYTFDENGSRIDNITDWGLEQFKLKAKSVKLKGGDKITKEDIFHYVYGVLHNPAYRKKYELNLKREFPRIPFYDDFWKWAKWGKELVELHIGYETAKPFKLKSQSEKLKGRVPKAKLKADKENGHIILDEETTLMGIPSEAWEYKLGNRSALEWILDQYKEKTPKDPTIREKFNTYKFADYKDKVIDLIARVTTVSVRTVEIMKEMGGEK